MTGHRPPLRRSWILFAAVLALGAVACDDEEPESQESADPIVGVMELPISYRYETSAPANAVAIEVGPSNLRVDGRTIVELDNGRLPEGTVAANTITELDHALESGPARRVATLRLFGSTPWRTTTLILNSLAEANLGEIAFLVRQGVGTDIGYLTLDNWAVREESDEYHEPPATHLRSWGEMPAIWEEMYTACREGPYVDCSFSPSNIAEGGNLHMKLFARGNAVKIEVDRFGAPDPEPAQPAQPDLLDGIDAPDVVQQLDEPAVTGAFTWRFQATTPAADEENVVAKTLRPLCGAQPCGATVEAEGQTPTMRVVSFIGAAFPNGTDQPYLMFQIPPE